MKNILFSQCLVMLLAFIGLNSNAQLVPCRPKICMIDYVYHNDNENNIHKAIIQAVKPDILIDNTPGGFWGEKNKGTGCLPKYYTNLGIKVFSYITSGYESTISISEQPAYYNDLSLNLGRIAAIYKDGATGVFLDQVSNFPDATRKLYIEAIYNQCQSVGLKLIVNPGTTSFDPWLMSHCDYLMSDELFDGIRMPSASELPYLDRILVVNHSSPSADAAAAISNGAYANGFGYSFACIDEYLTMSFWLEDPTLRDYYLSLLQQNAPATPQISLNGNTLQTNSTSGTQWYETTLGIINGATSATYSPNVSGTYYTITTSDLNCSSAPSNNIYFDTLGVKSIFKNEVLIYPNPVTAFVTIDLGISTIHNATVKVYNGLGKLVFSENMHQKSQKINLGALSAGVYVLIVALDGKSDSRKLIVK